MYIHPFDQSVILAISAFRLIGGHKQSNLAEAIGVHQSEYSRIEKGKRALTLGQLYLLAGSLNVPVVLIIKLAQAGLELRQRPITSAEVLKKMTSIGQEAGIPDSLTLSQIEFVLRKISLVNPATKIVN